MDNKIRLIEIKEKEKKKKRIQGLANRKYP